jgi:hypothetical protein
MSLCWIWHLIFKVSSSWLLKYLKFPLIGEGRGVVSVLRELVKNGHKLILFTIRSDVEDPASEDNSITCRPGKYLSDAVQWFKDNNVPLYGIQKNPTQHNTWTSSPKAYRNLIIDDAGLGVPLVMPVDS